MWLLILGGKKKQTFSYPQFFVCIYTCTHTHTYTQCVGYILRHPPFRFSSLHFSFIPSMGEAISSCIFKHFSACGPWQCLASDQSQEPLAFCPGVLHCCHYVGWNRSRFCIRACATQKSKANYLTSSRSNRSLSEKDSLKTHLMWLKWWSS